MKLATAVAFATVLLALTAGETAEKFVKPRWRSGTLLVLRCAPSCSGSVTPRLGSAVQRSARAAPRDPAFPYAFNARPANAHAPMSRHRGSGRRPTGRGLHVSAAMQRPPAQSMRACAQPQARCAPAQPPPRPPPARRHNAPRRPHPPALPLLSPPPSPFSPPRHRTPLAPPPPRSYLYSTNLAKKQTNDVIRTIDSMSWNNGLVPKGMHKCARLCKREGGGGVCAAWTFCWNQRRCQLLSRLPGSLAAAQPGAVSSMMGANPYDAQCASGVSQGKRGEGSGQTGATGGGSGAAAARAPVVGSGVWDPMLRRAELPVCLRGHGVCSSKPSNAGRQCVHALGAGCTVPSTPASPNANGSHSQLPRPRPPTTPAARLQAPSTRPSSPRPARRPCSPTPCSVTR